MITLISFLLIVCPHIELQIYRSRIQLYPYLIINFIIIG